jgi:hypothetical protein
VLRLEKAKVEHRAEFKELKKTIGDLELELREKAKAPHNVSTPNKTFKLRAELKELKETVKDLELELRLEKAEALHNVELRAELKELKEAVFVNKNSTDATSNGEDDVKGVVNTANATSVKEGYVNATSSEAKLAKLAKLVKLAKSTDLWCLSPYVPLSQEAKDKQRKVCLVNLRGEVCTANNCGSKHPEVCLVADHGKGKIPKAMCALWHMRVPFANPRAKSQGNSTGIKGKSSNKAKYLIKLEAEYRAEELKARIRATKMMLQGITYSQVVGGPAGPLSSTGPRRTTRRPDCSYSGQGNCHTQGYHLVADYFHSRPQKRY